jgi:hypothetical protein
MTRDRAKLEEACQKSIMEGMAADEVSRWVLEPIQSRRKTIHELLESDALFVSGVVIDRGVVNMPHLITESLRIELRVLRSIEDGIATAIKRGLEARQRLDEARQAKAEEPSKRLNF